MIRNRHIGRMCIMALTLTLASPVFANDVDAKDDVLTVDQCLSLAEKNNADIKIAKSKVDEAEASYHGKLGVLLPRLDANLSYNRYKWQLPAKKQRFGESLDDYYAEVVLSMPIFKGGKDYESIQAAKAILESEKQNLEQKKRIVFAAVKRSYYERVRAAITLAIQKELLKNLGEQARIAKLLYESGKISIVDVLKVDTQFAAAKDSLVFAENALRIRSLALGRVLGTDAPVKTINDVEKLGLPIAISRACVDAGFSNNPELRALKHQQEKFRSDVAIAKSAHYPTLSILGNYNWEDKTFFPGNPNWNVGASVSIPIFHGGSDQSAISEAEAKLKQADAKFEDIRKDLTVRFESAAATLQDSLNRMSTTEKVLSLAEESYKTAILRYKSGKLSALELIDAQTVWFNARLNYKKLIIDCHIAASEIEQICPTALPGGNRK